MRHQLLNGESIEIERLANESEDDLRRVVYRFAVAYYDMHGRVVDQFQATFAETNAMRRKGHWVKDHAPERILMGLRFHPKVYADWNTGRGEAIADLFTHLRRRRLGKAKKLR